MALIGLAPADDADDTGAAPSRDLRRRLPYLAVDAQDQHRFPGARHAGAAETFERRDEGHADPGGFLQRQAGGFFDHGCRFDDEMGRVGAVAADAEIARRAEHRFADQVGRTIDHDPGEVAARCAREDGVGHQAHRGLHVGRIDGRRGDLDQQVFGARGAQAEAFDNGRDAGGIRRLGVQAEACGLNRREDCG